jgi:hypothetical protein
MRPLLEEVLNFQIVNPKASEDEVLMYMMANKEMFVSKFS